MSGNGRTRNPYQVNQRLVRFFFCKKTQYVQSSSIHTGVRSDLQMLGIINSEELAKDKVALRMSN